jgi:hypothetical protein
MITRKSQKQRKIYGEHLLIAHQKGVRGGWHVIDHGKKWKRNANSREMISKKETSVVSFSIDPLPPTSALHTFSFMNGITYYRTGGGGEERRVWFIALLSNHI